MKENKNELSRSNRTQGKKKKKRRKDDRTRPFDSNCFFRRGKKLGRLFTTISIPKVLKENGWEKIKK